MKNVIISGLSGWSLFFLIYLMGCFAQGSFNIQNWTEKAREVVAVLGGISSILTILIMINFRKLKR